jgi:hypothetical protein
LQTEKWIQYHRCNILSMPLANHSIPPQNNIFLSILFSLFFLHWILFTFCFLLYLILTIFLFLFYDREWSQQEWSRGGKRPHCWWLWHINFIYSLPFGLYWFLAFICCSYFVITTFKYEKWPWMIFKLQSACVIQTTLEKSF